MDAKAAVSFAKENDAKFVDIRFTDLMGTWQHFTMPIAHFDEDKFEDGFAFDGSAANRFGNISWGDL